MDQVGYGDTAIERYGETSIESEIADGAADGRM